MKATDAALATLSRIRGGDGDATENATPTLRGVGKYATFRATLTPFGAAGKTAPASAG